MTNESYMVVDSNGNPLGEHMGLRHALIFIQALMNEFWQEPYLEYRIIREKKDVCEEVRR